MVITQLIYFRGDSLPPSHICAVENLTLPNVCSLSHSSPPTGRKENDFQGCTATHRFIDCVTWSVRLLSWISVIIWFISWINNPLIVVQTRQYGGTRGTTLLFAGKVILCGICMKHLPSVTLAFISWREWNMVLIVVLGNKHHDLNVHSAILLEASRRCCFCNLNPKQIQPLPSAVSPNPKPETQARVLPRLQRQSASAKAFCTEPHAVMTPFLDQSSTSSFVQAIHQSSTGMYCTSSWCGHHPCILSNRLYPAHDSGGSWTFPGTCTWGSKAFWIDVYMWPCSLNDLVLLWLQ